MYWDAENKGNQFLHFFKINNIYKNIPKFVFQGELDKSTEEKLRTFLKSIKFQALDFEIMSEKSCRWVF